MPPATPPSPPADLISPEAVAAFVKRWSEAALSERANYVSFLKELCALLELPQPDPATADHSRNAYVFERAVPFHDEKTGQTSTGFIDLHKRGCFTRVVALNAERAPEEAKGHIRYLRPEYQGRARPPGAPQQPLALTPAPSSKLPSPRSRPAKLAWPKTLAERTKALDTALATETQPLTTEEITKRFSHAKEEDVQEILETLAALGCLRRGEDGKAWIK